MRRRPKPAKAKVESRRPSARKPPKNENGRVRELEKRLAEALEQQAAAAEILRVISQSPTEVQPVFDAIVRTGAALCHAPDVIILIADRDALRVAASVGPVAASVQHSQLFADGGLPLTRGSVSGRAFIDRRTVHVHDVGAMSDHEFPEGKALQREYGGHGTTLAVPLLGKEVSLGVITLLRNEVSPFTDRQVALLQTFADQAVIAIENVRLFHETKEALEQQTATSEILRVISSSPTDVQPVFQTILDSAKRLLGAFSVTVAQRVGDELHLAALSSVTEASDATVREAFPFPIKDTSSAGPIEPFITSIRSRRPVVVSDAQTQLDIAEVQREVARARGFRSQLVVPMLREQHAIGVISVTRREAGGFTQDETALLRTFADQAVIAIENVRLFKELEARNQELTVALAQQTATSEVLAVISGAQTAVQPVFEAIVQSARRLCEASYSSVYRLDNQLVHLVAHNHQTPEAAETFRYVWPMPLTGDSFVVRAIRDNAVIHTDMQEDPTASAGLIARGKAAGHRRILVVPMVREGRPIGAIRVSRVEPTPFAEQHIGLLKTFADQAVIAIENVRLFTELEARNRDLTATSAILEVISSSPTDVQPVFDAIAANALRLCDATFSAVSRFDGELLHLAALHNLGEPGRMDALRRAYPRPPRQGGANDQAILTRAVVHVVDVQEDPAYQYGGLAEATGYRSIVAVPMLREGQPLGTITVTGASPRAFSARQVELLKTFADQAVIAIENVRLFKELETRNSDLTAALDKQTATSEILRVIGQSPTDVQPVFDVILHNATGLLRAHSAALTRIIDNQIVLAAFTASDEAGEALLNAQFPQDPRSSGSPHAIAIRAREPLNVVDIESDGRVGERGRAVARVRGYRSQLVVLLLRHEEPVGTISVTRRDAGGFSDGEIVLLKTFSDQAVIAIENVRLFQELQARTRELASSVEELKALGEVGRAVSSTLDLETVLSTIVARAVQLSGTLGGVIYEYEDASREFHVRATHQISQEQYEVLRATPVRLGQGAVGQAGALRKPVEVPDILDAQAPVAPQVQPIMVRLGYRALLALPLLFEDRIIGGLVVWRGEAGHFSTEIVNLLETFATQSVLAIQNARLFREIEDKSHQLEAASRHKSEFLANMSHELRTPLNAVIGFSEVLLQRMFGNLNAKQDEYLKDISASGQHLLSLINDILDLSKIEAGRMELTPAPFHLPSALDNAVTLVRERAARHGIALELDIDPGLGEVVGDERKVKQVVLNLLSNAVKFTPGGGRITLKAGLTDGAIEIAITDTGVGIAPEDQAAIFEEFRQVGRDETRKQEGTGLGLTLAKKFIELHGGRIWVESELGRGSTFTFTLPVS